MSFVEKNLTANERVQYTGKIHWYVYARTFFIFAIMALVIKSSYALGGFLFFLGIISLLSNIVLSKTTEFVVTNRRVILKTGFLKRKFIELQLNRAEGLVVEQSILGRMFNFGSVKIATGGVAESFPFLANPFGFKKEVNQAIENSVVLATAPQAY
ncbi:PH domain-containing protein [Mucilaginibacter robiniae]|uniref:PH domain-containing protein n=1 Tax=Mucilaginibacter robiniae TaxID=2728022 RepID=A0A7L5E464_9SPHI|nr:PH domain-containing protein [Mucilaginibacter robiniae]QJD97875.1 PH domain-containing protein [Mucilaginibacter robiniae]